MHSWYNSILISIFLAGAPTAAPPSTPPITATIPPSELPLYQMVEGGTLKVQWRLIIFYKKENLVATSFVILYAQTPHTVTKRLIFILTYMYLLHTMFIVIQLRCFHQIIFS